MSQFVRSSGKLDFDFLAIAFEASGDSVAMLDTDGTLVVINAGGAAALGFATPDAPVGGNWVELWDQKDREAARCALMTASRGERTSIRTSFRTATAGTTWWDSTLVAIPARAGRGRLLVISRNVTDQFQAGQALERSLRLHQALIEATSEIVWHLDVALGMTHRRGYVEFTGQQDDPFDMDGWLAAVHPEDHDRAKRAADQAEVTVGPLTIEYRLHHKSEGWRWVEDHATPLIDARGVVTDWVGIITDIHVRKTAEQAIRKTAEHLRLAVEATGFGTWDVDVVTGDRDWSPEMFDLLGISRQTRADRSFFISRIHPDDRARTILDLDSAQEGRTQSSVFRIMLPTGGHRWIEARERTYFGADGQPVRRVGTMQDVTDRKHAEHKLWLAAHADALTGLSNRTLFQMRLDDAVATATASGAMVGLLLLDLDRFKDVNDTLGHDAGDAMLQATAERLTRCVRGLGTVARLGGDEFGVIMPAPGGLVELETLAATLLEALQTPLIYAGRDVDCSASVGWSSFPVHDPEPSALLKNADVALYAAKAAGRGRAREFTPAMREEVERRVNVLRGAKDALFQDSIVPFYQPKVSLESGEIVGFEALLRWHDGRKIRPPAAIEEALDDPDLSIRLGDRMLERVVADMFAWAGADLPFGHVALNVAAAQFHGRCLSEQILEALDTAGLQPDQMQIEITERVLLDDGAALIGTALGRLHRAGIAIALDDFGTGFASLTHLTRFPVGWVKIDRSFIENLGRDTNSAAIVKAVIGLAHGIGAKVVAEGIETREQLDLLTRAGCDLGQGFLLGKPMSGARVPFCLKSRSLELARPDRHVGTIRKRPA